LAGGYADGGPDVGGGDAVIEQVGAAAAVFVDEIGEPNHVGRPNGEAAQAVGVVFARPGERFGQVGGKVSVQGVARRGVPVGEAPPTDQVLRTGGGDVRAEDVIDAAILHDGRVVDGDAGEGR